MDRMIYVAMSGAKETLLAQANTSNNLANVNSPGFLAELQQFRSMPVFGEGFPSRVYAMSERPGIDHSNGDVVHSGRELDVAIAGDGWLAVQARDGSEAYTRRGDLEIDSNGLLTTGNGLPVIGNKGPIAIPPSEKMEIGPDGTISVIPLGETADSLAEIDRIKMVRLEPGQLHKGRDGMMRHTEGTRVAADASVRLTTGALEGSNVNTVNAMVDMIELSRRYELQVKMMKTAGDIEESSASIMRIS